MADFRRAVMKTLSHEGGYVNDPDDPGGETKYGISKRAYPDLDIAALTREEAAQILRRDFWNRIKGDRLIDQRAAEVLFDFAVNAGVTTAVRTAQQCVLATRDGILGPVTLQHINTTQDFPLLLTIERVRYYTRRVLKRHDRRKFYVGWVRRALSFV